MRQIFSILIIFLLISCGSDKKEKTSVDKSEQTIPAEENKPEAKSLDTIIQDTFISEEIIEAKDSIIKSSEKEITDKGAISQENRAKEETITETVTETIPEEVKKVIADHSNWDELTKKYVSASGKVNYKGFKSELTKINTYLAHLQEVYPTKEWTKNEKLSYWFNLYNASTVQLIVNNYPVKSIKDINGGKPWDKKFIKSGDQVYSLNHIENTIVRPNFNEPRLHVAFNCAAISCPKLLNQAFTPIKLTGQLKKLAKSWILDTSKNKITENSIEISKIFEWYGADFKKGIIPFINAYSETKVNSEASISYLDYNWNLNE